MTLLRTHRMFTYEVGYTYSDHIRDDLGDPTGEMTNRPAAHVVRIVARNQTLADAWIEQKYNADYQSHWDFTMRCIDDQPAPYILTEVPY